MEREAARWGGGWGARLWRRADCPCSPQYPLYTASLALLDGTPVSYHLDEQRNWGLDIEEMERSLVAARKVCELVDARFR